MEENREIEIDLTKIITMLKKKAVFIVIFSIIGAALAGCYTNFFIEPQYTATVKLHAYSDSDSRITTSGSFTSSQYDATEKLINTYLVVVKSNTLTEKVADSIGNDMVTANQIRSMMSCSQIEDTLAFSISVTNTDPKLATDIANAVANICPDEIVRILKVGGVEVIDYANEPTSPSSPNLEKNIFVGFIIGLIISFLYFFIRILFDTKIHGNSDLAKEFDLPIIGSIPRIIPAQEPVKKPDSSDASQPTSPPPVDKITFGKEND